MKLVTLATAALGALAVATSAQAQSQPTNPGPVIPGVCTYNNQRAILSSLVGQSVTARMEQLSAAIQAELGGEAQAIEAEATSLEGQRSTLPADQFNQRAQALQQRAATWQQTANMRQAEMQYTEQQQLLRIAQTLDPILSQVYVERGCGIMFDSSVIYHSNAQMDVTDRVLELLNGQLQSLTFDRMPLPQQ